MRLIGTVAVLSVLLAVVLWFPGASPGQQQHVAPTPPLTPAEQLKKMRVPTGFVIELVAAEPLIHKPLNLAFDDLGRLWVTETVEYPFPAPPDRKPRDAVKIIVLSEGLPSKKIITFADGLNIPIGVLPLPTGRAGGVSPPSSARPPLSAIVHSIPNVWRLTDTDGDSVADRREILMSGFGFKDTHGMTGSFTWGFDGWIYAHHGFSNTSEIKGADGSTIKMRSGNTYRFRPDRPRVEQFTWGQVNPFGLCFDPLGNLFSADCHTKPAMMLLRGGWYESFGKPHDGLGYAPTMMAHSHGSTAISGITFYAADHFPPAYRDLLYIGNVVTNRINLDRLERHGSTYRAIQLPDFVVSDDPWFRPVDIKLGPDGALYVADFYNRIIGHYEVPLDHPGRDRERGRIWRIRYVGGPQPLDPPRNLTKLTTSQLVDELGHPNLTVRIMAANLLVERGKEQVEPAVRGVLRPQSSPLQRVHGMWVLERLGVLDDDTLLKLAGDIDPAVRVHVMRVLAERSEVHCCFLDLLRTGLTDPDAMVRRAAADALGRHPDPGNLRPLLDLRSKVPADDTHLLHTVRMALRNQLRPPDHWTKLPDPLPETDARAIADVAPGLATPQAGAYLVRHLQKYPETGETLLGQVRHAARHVADDLQGSLIDLAKTNKPGDIRHQATLLKAIQQGTQERGGKLGDDARLWAESLIARLLAAREADLQQLGIELAGSLKYRPAEPILVALAKRRDLNEKLRQAAVSSLVSIEPGEQIGLLVGLLLDINEKMPIREHAANVLAGINHPASRSELVRALTIVPARLQTIIAYGLAGSPAGAEQLLDAVSQGKASARLLQERPVEARLSQVKLPNLKDRLARLTAGLPPAEQRLQELLKQRQDGFNKAKPDIKLGALLYQKHCAGCHQIGNQGAKVGPQLDGIGIRGIDRLLEDIIDPNRNVDQAFRASTLALKNGQVVQGLVLREEGEVLIVADPQGKELRIAKKDIEERTVTQLSPMPANVIDQIPEAELYHLLGFLLEQRTPAGK